MVRSETLSVLYFLLISIISFMCVGADKYSSVKGGWRIRERTFFLLSLLGGSAAVYFAMGIFNHKTQKNGFVFIIPLIFFAQCAVVFILYKNGLIFR